MPTSGRHTQASPRQHRTTEDRAVGTGDFLHRPFPNRLLRFRNSHLCLEHVSGHWRNLVSPRLTPAIVARRPARPLALTPVAFGWPAAPVLRREPSRFGPCTPLRISLAIGDRRRLRARPTRFRRQSLRGCTGGLIVAAFLNDGICRSIAMTAIPASIRSTPGHW
jgi:hypothetical protein